MSKILLFPVIQLDFFLISIYIIKNGLFVLVRSVLKYVYFTHVLDEIVFRKCFLCVMSKILKIKT